MNYDFEHIGCLFPEWNQFRFTDLEKNVDIALQCPPQTGWLRIVVRYEWPSSHMADSITATCDLQDILSNMQVFETLLSEHKHRIIHAKHSFVVSDRGTNQDKYHACF